MHLKIFTLISLLSLTLLQANPSPCGCTKPEVQSLFDHGWNTVETNPEKNYAHILRENFGIDTNAEFQIISLRKRPLAFFTDGWLYEFRVEKNAQENLVYLINYNMRSVVLGNPKQVLRFFKKNVPVLTSDLAVLEYLVVNNQVADKNETTPKLILSVNQVPQDISQHGLYVAAPRVVHNDSRKSLVQAFVSTNSGVFSALYEVSHDQMGIVMKDAFKVSNTQKNKGCSASYTNMGVSYIEMGQTNTTQVDLH